MSKKRIQPTRDCDLLQIHSNEINVILVQMNRPMEQNIEFI